MEVFYDWDQKKNEWLRANRGVSFEMAVAAIENGDVLDVKKNKKPREHQQLFIISLREYVYVVPAVVDGSKIFFKTMYPSRKLYKKLYEKET